MSQPQHSNLKQLIFTNLLTLVISITSSIFALESQKEASSSSIYNSTLERMKAQDELISSMQVQITQASIRIIELESEVRKEVQYADVLSAYIDSLPTPAWIKKARPDGVFEMFLINDAYSKAYGISKKRYEGKSDSEVWPKEIAELWTKNDRQVYNSGTSIKTYEYMFELGKQKKISVWKFAIDLSDGQQGVGGLVVGDAKLNTNQIK